MDHTIYYGNGGASSWVSDVDRYVIIRQISRVYFKYISGIHRPVDISDILTQDFSSVRLPTQSVMYRGQ
jgi:hypothetical protein